MKVKTGNTILFFLIVFQSSNYLIHGQNYGAKISEANREIYEFPNKAIEVGQEVYEASDSTLEEKVDALMLISTAYSSKRNYVMSLEYANRAHALLDEIKSRSFKIKILNKVGAQYQQLKIYDKAINFLDEALKVADFDKNKDSIANHLGYNYGTRGFIYREQMSCEIALNYFNKSLYYFHKSLKTDPIMNANISIINYNKGNCFNYLKQIDSAKISFDIAIEYAKVKDAKSLEGFAKKGLSEVYTSEGNYVLAIETLKNGLEISSDVGDLILNQGIYKGLSDNYLAINDRANHLYYKAKFEEVQSIIRNTEKSTINNSLISVFNENKAELSSLHARLNINTIGFIFISIAFIIVLFIEIRAYLIKSKELLSTKKDLLSNRKSH